MKQADNSTVHPSVSQQPNSRIDRVVEGVLFKRLSQVAKNHKITLKSMVLYALHSALLNINIKYDGVIGVVSNGRKEELSDPLQSLGLYWNMLPLRFSELTALPLIKSIHETLLASDRFGVYPVALDENYHQPSVTFNFVNFHNKFSMGEEHGFELLNEQWHDRFHYPLNLYVSGGENTNQNLIRMESNAEYINTCDANKLMDEFIEYLSEISMNRFWLANKNVVSD